MKSTYSQLRMKEIFLIPIQSCLHFPNPLILPVGRGRAAQLRPRSDMSSIITLRRTLQNFKSTIFKSQPFQFPSNSCLLKATFVLRLVVPMYQLLALSILRCIKEFNQLYFKNLVQNQLMLFLSLKKCKRKELPERQKTSCFSRSGF